MTIHKIGNGNWSNMPIRNHIISVVSRVPEIHDCISIEIVIVIIVSDTPFVFAAKDLNCSIIELLFFHSLRGFK